MSHAVTRSSMATQPDVEMARINLGMLLVAAQDWTKESAGAVRGQCELRIAFKVRERYTSQVLIGCQDATRLRSWLAAYREGRDLVEIGAYKPGTNPRLDEALSRLPAIEAFLRQTPREVTSLAETRELLQMVVRGGAA